MSPTKNIIGVTGTKGKGTTSTLIARLLEGSGHKVHLGGNIGKSAIDLLKEQIQPEDYVVIEMSSFQLTDFKYSSHIAVCLMVVPEHLNVHSDMDEYLSAKRNIFAHQSASDIAIYYADNELSKELSNASPGKKIPYFSAPGCYVKNDDFVIDDQVVCQVNEVKLIGEHNWQNICAALTAYWQVDQDLENARKVTQSFNGLEHRLESVGVKNGLTYYNDSYASVPDATIAAIEAIKGLKVLLIGGFDRGLEIDHLASDIKDHEEDIEQVILIGASAQRVAEEFKKVGFAKYQLCTAKTMKEIVELASSVAQPNTSIVLSPGFPSFDMFKNFSDRGEQFKEVINSL